MATNNSIGNGLKTEQLRSLATELHGLRDYPPIVSKGNGKYEGDILGFVKGLRISARIIYFLREQLSDMDYEINWGHLLDDAEASCSPDCDIIIHIKGHVRKWNDTNKPIMDFNFIKAKNAEIVVSCKSKLGKIDKEYPKSLKKYGVNYIFLVAECCKEIQYHSLKKRARRAGYAGLYCLYFMDKNETMKCDESVHAEFINVIRKVLIKAKQKRESRE